MKIVTIPCLFDNYAYLLICEQTGSAAVIDPGEAFPVWRELESRSVTLTKILLTHHHHDHIGGIDDLLAEQPDVEVCGFHSDRGRVSAITTPLSHGDVIAVGEEKGRVLHTPGHTSGSVCYLFESDLFTGDTLFGSGCGRLFEGDAEQMYSSLYGQIAVLPPETSVYFGHEYTEKNLQFAKQVEPDNSGVSDRLEDVCAKKKQGMGSVPSILSLEMETNPFLRCDSEAIRRRLQGVDSGDAGARVFALLRQARNNF